MTSFLVWSKNDLSIFCRTRYALSNAVFRFSLRCVVFEITGGGRYPPPPGRPKVAQTPGRARVNASAARRRLGPTGRLTGLLLKRDCSGGRGRHKDAFAPEAG